jgi:hypothetical protein
VVCQALAPWQGLGQVSPAQRNMGIEGTCAMYVCMYMFKQLHSIRLKRGTASTDRSTFATAAMRWLRQLQDRQAVLQLQHQTHDLLPGSVFNR